VSVAGRRGFASSAGARLSLSDVNTRVQSLEKAERDAAAQLIMDSVVVGAVDEQAPECATRPCTVLDTSGTNFDNGASPTSIRATIPGVVAPGSYQLTIDTGASREQFDAVVSALGADGAPGADGNDGADGADGLVGADGTDGVEGADGATGPQGLADADGLARADGAYRSARLGRAGRGHRASGTTGRRGPAD
jgi:hypothetical protein